MQQQRSERYNISLEGLSYQQSTTKPNRRSKNVSLERLLLAPSEPVIKIELMDPIKIPSPLKND